MTEDSPRCCVIIPVFRHAQPLLSVLRELEKYGLPCFLVDDGNENPLQEALKAELAQWPWVRVLRLTMHGGKGAACMEGCRAAYASGFSHAIFIDADDQHEVQDISNILVLLRQHPEAMILGRPVFDRSAPLKRRFGRIVSNVWVWIETLSFDIQDSLCGFRCFPLKPLLEIAADAPLGCRMDFDPDIVVRLFWKGIPVVNFDTRIRYPTDGISNFRLLRDNGALFWLHTRLFFGMILRIPLLASRHWNRGR
jgi:glycosyltransferase involved in cell wall biosynthesis